MPGAVNGGTGTDTVTEVVLSPGGASVGTFVRAVAPGTVVVAVSAKLMAGRAGPVSFPATGTIAVWPGWTVTGAGVRNAKSLKP